MKTVDEVVARRMQDPEWRAEYERQSKILDAELNSALEMERRERRQGYDKNMPATHM